MKVFKDISNISLSKAQVRKLVAVAVVLVIIFFFCNPQLIPFVPDSFRKSVQDTASKIFGDVEGLAGLFTINWGSLFRLVIMVLSLYLVKGLCKYCLSRIKTDDNHVRSWISFASSLLNYVFTIVGIIWGLSIVGVNVSAIFAGVSILALAISFGAESLVEDVITGVFLAFDKELNVGDIVEIDGFRGTVKEIGVRCTYIMDAGGNVQTINNSDIRKVLNRSAAESTAVVDVSISYAADLVKVESALNEILTGLGEKYGGILLEDPRYLGVEDLGESAVVLRVVAKVAESNIFTAKRILRREIKLGFDRLGVEIPFNQLVIHQADDEEEK